jgi:hypothetical protein
MGTEGDSRDRASTTRAKEYRPRRQNCEGWGAESLEGRQTALAGLVHAVRQYRKVAEAKPLTLQGSEYARAVKELDEAIERAEGLIQA